MRDTIRPGSTREATFRGAPSGRAPGTITLEVLDASDGTIHRAASADGVTERATGAGVSTYATTYVAPATAGLWLERWRDTVPTPDVVVDDELLVDASAPAGASLTGAVTYAAAQDLIDYVAETPGAALLPSTSEGILRVLRRAELDIDRVLGPLPRNTATGLKVDPANLLDYERAALARAVSVQAYHLIKAGDTLALADTPRPVASVEGPDFKTTYATAPAPATVAPRATGRLSPLVALELEPLEWLRPRGARARA